MGMGKELGVKDKVWGGREESGQGTVLSCLGMGCGLIRNWAQGFPVEHDLRGMSICQH